ncbi:MAG: glycosyltransferase family 4 protein [Candidatus Pacebacteria bacterium]|nr:glycosyltransferase family 4 protein [Candidatus Paceibacterota bacterium]
MAKEFVRIGHNVTILTSNRFFPFPKYDSTVRKMLGSRIVGSGRKKNHGIEIIRKPVIIEAFCRTIFAGHKQVISSFHPDIVFVNGTATYNAIIISLLKPRNGFSLKTFDSHLPSEFDRTDGILKRMAYGVFRLCCSSLLNSRVDTFIAVQDDTVQLMHMAYGVDKPIQLIDLGTDTSLFSFTAKGRKQRRAELHIKDDIVVGLYTGKIIEAKGIHILLDAFGRLEKTCPNLHLVFVGDGPQEYKDALLRLVKDGSRLHFVGIQSQENLSSWYSMADFAVWPLQDTTAMNEAASCRLPFIANDKLGAKTRVSNNNAVLYKRGDGKNLAEKIKNLYAHPVERKKMGDRGRELVIQKLSWTKIAGEYLERVNRCK